MEKKSRPQDNWDKKNGYVLKSFKMYQTLFDEFKATCQRLGVTQSGQISKLMKQFVEENREKQRNAMKIPGCKEDGINRLRD